MIAFGDKFQLLAKILASAEKQFGQGALIQIGTQTTSPTIENIPTGSIGLDYALGVGGWPKGRLIELFGPPSSGKSTLALLAVRECQKQGGIAAYIDAEHALDLGYAKNLGVRVEEMLLSQPDTEEQGLGIVDTLAHSGAVSLIVIDSVAALTPHAEMEGEVGDYHPGLQARLMSQALRKLISAVAKTSTTLLFLNQLRHRLGLDLMFHETTPGGHALKFFSAVRVDLRVIDTMKTGHQRLGHRIRASVIKNKIASCCRDVEFEIRQGTGVYSLAEFLDWGVMFGLIDASGAWYTYQDTILGQGRERACLHLSQQPEILQHLQHSVFERMQQELQQQRRSIAVGS